MITEEKERAELLIDYLNALKGLDGVWHTDELMKSIHVTTKEIERILIERK